MIRDIAVMALENLAHVMAAALPQMIIAKRNIQTNRGIAEMEHALTAKAHVKQQIQLLLDIAKQMQLAQTAQAHVKQTIRIKQDTAAQRQRAAATIRVRQKTQTAKGIAKMENVMATVIVK